jgi:hypothetical protein
MNTEVERIYPITFVDYVIIVPSQGVIMFDEEMKAEQLCVNDGDKFEVAIKNGRITMLKIEQHLEVEQGLLKNLDGVKPGIQGIW